MSSLRAFQRPRLWLALWWLGWVACVVLSLGHPPDLGVDVPDGDKIEHLLAYGLLSAWAAWLYATPRSRLLACLALVALGIAMELAQGAFTTDRMMDVRDGVADAIGVALGQLAALGPAGGWLQRLDARLFARR